MGIPMVDTTISNINRWGCIKQGIPPPQVFSLPEPQLNHLNHGITSLCHHGSPAVGKWLKFLVHHLML